MSTAKNVLVIGAGPAGMAATCSLIGQADINVSCYEMNHEIGGLWAYSAEIGDHVHQGMYVHHQTNGLNEMLELPDYSFHDHFGHAITAYPPRAIMLDYLQGWTRHRGAGDAFTLNRKVTGVTFDAKTAKFTVVSQDTKTAARHTAYFDNVIVCCGHFSVPNYPAPMPGIEDFPGLIIHSHNFRDGADFKGDRLLVVGTGYSGEDIAMQCYKFGSPMVTVLHRTAPMAHDFKDWKIDEKPVAGTRYDKTTNQFVFADGTSNTYDKIIYCTGYKHTFPFLAPDLQFSTNNRLIPNTLWKATVLPTNNALFFVGMPDQYYTFSYFQGQALFIKGIIEGKVTLPTAEAMLADTADWQAREDALGDDHKTHHRFQYQHMAEACTLAGCSFRDDSGHFDQWLDDRHHNILTYRDQTAISSVSGTRSVTLPMPWTEYMNDDKQVYLDHCRAAHEKNIKAAQQ